MRFQPIVVEAMIWPVAFAARSEEVMDGIQVVPRVVREEEAFWRFTTLVKVVEAENTLFPEKVLLSESKVEEATVMQVEPMAKHPEVMLRPPPLERKEEVAVPETLSAPLTENTVPGEEVPMPKLPPEVKRPASVSVPLFNTENVRSPLPPLKFCWRIDVIAAVVVALPYASSVR